MDFDTLNRGSLCVGLDRASPVGNCRFTWMNSLSVIRDGTLAVYVVHNFISVEYVTIDGIVT